MLSKEKEVKFGLSLKLYIKLVTFSFMMQMEQSKIFHLYLSRLDKRIINYHKYAKKHR